MNKLTGAGVEYIPANKDDQLSEEIKESLMDGEDQSLTKDGLEERIKIYALHWIETGNKYEAYKQAGYAYPKNAYKFHRKYQKEIEKYVWSAGFKDKVPQALNTLMDVMMNSRSDTARTKAAIELLDRAGFTKDTKLSISSEDSKKLEEQEINRQIKQLIESAGGVFVLPSAESDEDGTDEM